MIRPSLAENPELLEVVRAQWQRVYKEIRAEQEQQKVLRVKATESAKVDALNSQEKVSI